MATLGRIKQKTGLVTEGSQNGKWGQGGFVFKKVDTRTYFLEDQAEPE